MTDMLPHSWAQKGETLGEDKDNLVITHFLQKSV